MGLPRIVLVAVLATALLVACGAGDRAVATWDLAPTQVLDSDVTQLTMLVTRLGCNNGATGTVNQPEIRITDDEVVLTFTVSPGPPEAATCPGNDAVAYVVELPESLGARALMDGACRAAEIVDALPCSRGGDRRTP